MNWKPAWIDQENYLKLEDLPGEQWKHFVQWKGHQLRDYYYISNLGRIKSLCPHHKAKILPGTLDISSGEYVGTFVRTESRGQIYVAYHQAVAYYFIGPPPRYLENPCVDHIDSDKLNNRANNLQWLTVAENTRKALKEGKCGIFLKNGGWNRRPCYFLEFPENHFSSLQEAAEFIGRNTDYVAECIRLQRDIRHKHLNKILHVVLEDRNG